MRRSNATWDILLAPKEEAKSLAGSIPTTKAVRLQIGYMGTQKTYVILPMYISEDHLGAFMAKYGHAEEVPSVKS